MNILYQVLLLAILAVYMAGCGGSDPFDLRNDAPDIRISAPSSVGFNEEVILDGSASRDVDGDIDEKSYEWSQDATDGLQIALTFNANQSVARFTTPESFVGKIDLHFTLRAKDMEGKSASRSVTVRLNGSSAYRVKGKVSADSSSHVDSDINNPRAIYKSNDTFEKAQSINNPSRVVGYVNKKDEGVEGRSKVNGDRRDFYKLNLLKNQTIEFSYFLGVEKKQDDRIFFENDFDLYLYTKDKTLIDVIVEGDVVDIQLSKNKKEKRETVFLSVPEKGEYYVEVYAGRGAGSYKLEVTDKIHQSKSGELSLSADFVVDEVIVKYSSGVDLEYQSSRSNKSKNSQAKDLLRIAGGHASIANGESSHLALFKFSSFTSKNKSLRSKATTQQAKLETLKKISQLRQKKGVIYAEPNFILKPLATKPNDPLYESQWHYDTINLPKAWDISTGDSDVVVAVLDTGIHADHPDFSGQTIRNGYDFIKDWKNAGDDIPDFIYPPNYSSIDPDPTDAIKKFSHGTHVSGTIMAASDNEIGVSGIAWKTSLMPVRVLGRFGGTSYDVTQGILYAAGLKNDSGIILDETQRADVINMSLGGVGFSQLEQDTVSQARKNGVIIVAASGNDGDGAVMYPAGYKGVVAVGSVQKDKKLTDYSNYGVAQDVVAPGGDTDSKREDGVLSLYADGDKYEYEYAQGTSMASPHVAGVIALMKAKYPAMTPAYLDIWLEGEILTTDLGDFGHDYKYGSGLIDAHKALKVAQQAQENGAESVYLPPRLKLGPQRLNFDYDFNRLPFVIESIPNPDGDKLEIVRVVSDKSWLSIDKSQVLYGYGVYEAVIDRAKMDKTIFTATVSVVINVKKDKDDKGIERTLTLNVFVNNGEKIISLYGVLDVLLYDPYDLSYPRPPIYHAEAKEVSSLRGVYSFSFENVEEGKYDILSAIDIDNDNLLSSKRFDLIGYPKNLPFDGPYFNVDVVKDVDIDFSISVRAGQ